MIQTISDIVLRVGNSAGVNGPWMFLAKGGNVHPRLRGANLMTRYIFSEGSCVIPNKESYMDGDTWSKVVKVVSPGIIKMKVINVASVYPVLLYIYLTLHLRPSNFSSYYL